MQLRQLELAAGLPLLEQIGRRVHLTDAGRELLRYAAGISDLLREAEDAMKALQGVGGGELSLAVTSTAKYFAPRLLAEFRRSHPEVRLRLAVSNREAVVRELTENTVDLAVMGRPPRGLDTEAAPFARHPIAIIAAPDHPLVGRKRVPLERLAGETFIIRERGSGTRAAMEHVFAERGFKRARNARDEQQRDHQAGGDGRDGHRVPVDAHHRPGAARRAPGPARGQRAAGDARVVRDPPARQAALARGAGVQVLPPGERAPQARRRLIARAVRLSTPLL